MNREIKFRAWDKGKMIEPMGLLLRDAPKWLDELSSEAILMQYTGMKDKNGKEIWEGDILKITQFYQWDIPSPWKKIVKVEMSLLDGVAYMVISPKPQKYADGHESYRTVWPIANNSRADEVIGNIYENPELIALAREGERK